MGEERDQAIRDVVKGAGVIYIGLFLNLLIAFFAQVLAARYLSISDFGGLTAGTALLDVGAIVASLGFAAGLRRFLPRLEEAEKRIIVTITLGITIVTSVVLGLLVYLNAGFIAGEIFGTPEVAISIRIFGAAIPFATVLNVSIGGIRGQERSVPRVIVKDILSPLVRFGLVITAVLYGWEQAGFATAYAVPYVLGSVVALWFLHRVLPGERSRVGRDSIESVVRFSLPFTISNLSGFVYRSLDIFLILYFLGGTETGIYGVAYGAVSFMGIYGTAFSFLGAPIASKLEHAGNVDDVMTMFRSIVRWLVVGSVLTLVPLGVFATEFISVIYRPNYAPGGPVLAVLAVGYALKNVLSVHEPVLEALGRPKLISFNNAVAALSNLGLNLVLIPRYGMIGAAVATGVSFLLRGGLASVQVYYELGRTPMTWRSLRPLVLGVPFLAVMWTVVEPLVPGTFLWLVAATALSASVYVGAVLVAFGLTRTERMIIQSAEEQYGLPIGPLDGVIEWLGRRSN